MDNLTIAIAVAVIVIAIAVIASARCEITEGFRRQLGGRKFWNFGRESGYGVKDHGFDNGRCYQYNRHIASLNRCIDGYSPIVLASGDVLCCVNESNY